MKYAEVYTSIKTLEVNHPFDYSIPSALKDSICTGSMVIVPFGQRQEIGFVTKVKDHTKIAAEDLKTVTEIISNIPAFNKETLRLIYWMSAYYLQPFGKIIEFFLPPGNKKKVLEVFKDPESFFRYEKVIYLSKTSTGAIAEVYSSGRSRAQQRILDLLRQSDGITLKDLIDKAKVSRSSVSALLKKNIIELRKRRRVDSGCRERTGTVDLQEIKKKSVLKDENARTLSRDITYSIKNNLFKAFVLYDFRINDRLNLYRAACSSALDNNKTVLLLTPEIIDAENLFDLFYDPEMGKKQIFHSGLKESEQLSRWYDIYSGNIDLIIGNRSAIFLPFRNIGLVIIDEEHDPSYKESTIVRYNVQDIALKLCRYLRIPVLFASNTPSMRLWHRAKVERDFRILRPDISFYRDNKVSKEVLDLKTVDSFKEDINITNKLYKTIKNELRAGNKALVFFNRRGYSSFLICRDCGYIPLCPRCRVSFSYHRNDSMLLCHHCSLRQDFTGQCENCGSTNMQYSGTGIEKIESKLKKRFTDTKFLRIDSDFVKNRDEGRAIRKILSADGPLLILGTQKVLKNSVIRDLTAASIIDFDSLFQLPDFQINERVFQLLIQVLSKIKNTYESKFLIQAFNIKNEVLGSFLDGEYEDFYKKEIKKRKNLQYPPYSSLINIIVAGRDDESVDRDIKALAGRISGIKKAEFLMLGPAPAPFYRRNLVYRRHILIKTGSVIRFNNNIKKILKDYRKNIENKIIFDIDPVWIL